MTSRRCVRKLLGVRSPGEVVEHRTYQKALVHYTLSRTEGVEIAHESGVTETPCIGEEHPNAPESFQPVELRTKRDGIFPAL